MDTIRSENKAVNRSEHKIPAELFPEPVRGRKKVAYEQFLSRGIPDRRSEDYKYSPLSKILPGHIIFSEPEPGDANVSAAQFLIPGLDAFVLVVRNGVLDRKSSRLSGLPPVVQIASHYEAFLMPHFQALGYYDQLVCRFKEPVADLNTIMSRDGIYIHIPEGIVLSRPIHIISIFSESVSALHYPRLLIIAEKGSKAEVIESFHPVAANGKINVNALAELFVKQNAGLRYYMFQHAGKEATLLTNTYASVGEQGHFDTNTVTLSGKWIRNNLRISQDGKASEVHLNGLVVASGEQHVDNSTLVDHRHPYGESRQLYKGILSGRSTGIFNGKIHVRPDAQKTNAFQSSKNILLSDDASINAKPELEIYADDVKCSHGSSTGKLDESALFYFRSRGIGAENAKRLLLGAFCADVLGTVKNDVLKEFLAQQIEISLLHA